MKYRKLRIAASVFFASVTLLLVILWVRSYVVWESVNGILPFRGYFSADSALGKFWAHVGQLGPGESSDWSMSSSRWGEDVDPESLEWTNAGFGISFDDGIFLSLPYWFAVLLSIGMGAIPWITPHFCLRTLLIGMTLVAVLLWVLIWATRS
jgi:hypothetical protein